MSVYADLNESQQFAARVIADHARATAFAIADGILPGNEGRNYVLRKIMRRAIYHGREHLGLTDLFFYKVCDEVVNRMHDAYPELETQRDFIGKMVRLEEERFGTTLIVGLDKLDSDDIVQAVHIMKQSSNVVELESNYNQLLHFIEENGVKSFLPSDNHETDELVWHVVSEDTAEPKPVPARVTDLLSNTTDLGEIGKAYKEKSAEFVTKTIRNAQIQQLSEKIKPLARLYDTYGTPKDLIRLKLEEQDLVFSEEAYSEAFDKALDAIQQQSGIGKTERKSQISPIYAEVLEKIGATKFHGYDATHLESAKVVAILDGSEPGAVATGLKEGQQGSVVLDNTPFYAESGGQVGDTGKLISSEVSATVADTYSPVAGLIIHKVTVDKGELKVGDSVTASVDVEKRDATRRNHTATHLVHAALKEVLGSHVKQAGSVVAPNYLRFDFSHYQPMTASELAEVEDLVNHYILQNEPVTTNMMALEDAMRSGAVAMFGEKYGSEVRVLSVGGGEFSRELCGGTHVRATGDIGSFKITSDEAIASGVRRIRAITGFDAFARFREDEKLIDASLGALNTQRDNLPNAIARLQEDLKKTRKEMDDLKLKIATGSIGNGSSSNGDESRDVSGVKVLAKIVDGLDANGTRQLSDTLLARLKSGVVVIGRASDGKVGIIVRVSDDLTDKVKAGNVIKEITPIVGGKGGGKADMAEGGGSEPEKLSEAIDASYGVIEKMLG